MAAITTCVEGESELCRELTQTEKGWLAQSSLVCIIARVNSVACSGEAVKAAFTKVLHRQPYLNLCIDPEALRFRLIDGVCVSEETVELNACDKESVRDIARKELLKGVDRNKYFARIHIATSTDGSVSHLMVFCDHLAFDAKSLVILLTATLEHLGSTRDTDSTMLPFVDWSSLIPEVKLAPFEGVDSILLQTKAVAPEELPSCPPVEGLVFNMSSHTFNNLKSASKNRGCTLNGPLMTAFLAAVTESARKQKKVVTDTDNTDESEVAIRSVCAVDLRRRLNLPSDYMNNSASVVKCTAVIPPSRVITASLLWDAAIQSQEELMRSIDEDEGYRLHDITKRMAFAEMGPIFAIPCLWSNVGHVDNQGGTIEACEVLIAGAGSNHVISGHCIETSGEMALTITYSPSFHDVSTVKEIGESFKGFVEMLASG